MRPTTTFSTLATSRRFSVSLTAPILFMYHTPFSPFVTRHSF
jgi:hypothetical protein